jgi:DHA2 family multidrug resistance protein
MASEQPHIDSRDVMTPQLWATVLGVSLGSFMAIIDIQIINASLREIQGSLGLDMSESGWISTAYLIAEIVVIPLTGYLSKAFGMRKYILWNSSLFIIASIFCGFSWNLHSMVFFRVLQGLTGGTLIPLSFQTMLTDLPESKRNLGLAIFGTTATLAPTLGPTVGGWLTENYGWRSIFYINMVPGIIMLSLIRFGMPSSLGNKKLIKRMDFLGAITLCLSLGTFTYILEEGAQNDWFTDNSIRLCTLVSLMSFAIFMASQLLKKEPLLNLKLLLERNFGLSAAITAVAAMGLYGGVFATAVYLGQVHNYGPQDIGSVMMWIGIPQLFVMPFVPWLMRWVDLRLLAVIGFSLFAGSNYLNAHLSFLYSGEQFQTSLILRAIGQPLFMIPLSALAMGMISKEEAGNASSIYNVVRNLGGSIGIALTTNFLVSRGQLHLSNAISSVDFQGPVIQMNTTELYQTFLKNGQNRIEAMNSVAGEVIKLAYREAMVQSFGDVFFLTSIVLASCIVLILFIKKAKVSESSFGSH